MSKSNESSKSSKLAIAAKVCFGIGITAAAIAGGMFLYQRGFDAGKIAGESAGTLMDLASKFSK